MAKIIVFILEK